MRVGVRSKEKIWDVCAVRGVEEYADCAVHVRGGCGKV